MAVMRLLLVFGLIAGTVSAEADRLKLVEVATLGEAHPLEKVRAKGADVITQVHWLDADHILAIGIGGEGRFVRCTTVSTKKRLWEKRFEGALKSITLAVDGTELVIAMPEDESVEDPGKAVVAIAIDPMKGDETRKILAGDVFKAARRDPALSTLTDIYAGHTKQTHVAVFLDSEREVLNKRRKLREQKKQDGEKDQGDKQDNSEESKEDQAPEQGASDKDDPSVDGDPSEEEPLEGVYGIRGYLIDSKEQAVTAKYKTDVHFHAHQVSADGKLIGCVAPNDFYVYDTKRRRDQIIAGRHKTKPGGTGYEIDAPFYSGIRFSKRHAVVARDSPGGPQPARVIIVDMITGKLLANQDTLMGHVAIDVGWRYKFVAITGSSKHLQIIDFRGKQMLKVDDISKARNLAVSFSPDGKKLALGGYLNVVQVYAIRAR